MIGKKRKVKNESTGKEHEGTVVAIEQMMVRPFDVSLSDGTVLRAKPSIQEVIRIEGAYDNEGYPLYVVRSNNEFIVSYAKEELMKGGSHGS